MLWPLILPFVVQFATLAVSAILGARAADTELLEASVRLLSGALVVSAAAGAALLARRLLRLLADAMAALPLLQGAR